MTEPMTIQPYWNNATWVFDDPAVDLVQEPFVKGAPVIIDELVSGIINARAGVRLVFSDSPFVGFQRSLTLKREEDGGAWYGLDHSPLEGWLCPMLFRYFSHAPIKLYVRAEPKEE
jgi:hypothetical protein